MKAIEKEFKNLRRAQTALQNTPTDLKNKILNKIAEQIQNQYADIETANKKDLKLLSENTAPAFRDRLTINKKRIEGMAESLIQVAALPDPTNEVIENKVLKNGLVVKKVRAPLGVIFMIFESRPNVILEAFSLAFKSGNAIALRGGKESQHTANVFFKIMRNVFEHFNITPLPFFGFNNYDRKIVHHLLKRNDLVDVVVPRGGDKLIQFVQQNAHMPIIKNDRGLCHTYVHEDANLDMAAKIVINAKTSRPGVCNALETVLVHESVANLFIPQLFSLTQKHNVIWYCDKKSEITLLKSTSFNKKTDKKLVNKAKPKNWDTEYLDLKLNVKVVADLNEALAHIEKHGSKHSEAIVTASESTAREFQSRVDAAAVYWNASTRFTDGFEFGLGGELGISTQKIHVRGPVGLNELTTPRWIIDGTGQVRL